MANDGHNLLLRQRAVKACLDRFAGQRLEWGRRDCVKLAALALRKQGVPVPLLKGVRYSSAATGLRRLQELDHDDLAAAVDATGLPRIAPAMALPGDLVALPGRDGDPFAVSLMVVVTAGCARLLGLDGTGRFAVIAPAGLYECAWRVTRG